MIHNDNKSERGAIFPRDTDVLCGKSRSCVNHIGSRRYREYLDTFRGRYAQAKTRKDKVQLIYEIYQNLSPSCRFLTFNKNLGEWEELSATKARDKIGHALRHANATRDEPTDDPDIETRSLLLHPARVASQAASVPQLAAQQPSSGSDMLPLPEVQQTLHQQPPAISGSQEGQGGGSVPTSATAGTGTVSGAPGYPLSDMITQDPYSMPSFAALQAASQAMGRGNQGEFQQIQQQILHGSAVETEGASWNWGQSQAPNFASLQTTPLPALGGAFQQGSEMMGMHSFMGATSSSSSVTESGRTMTSGGAPVLPSLQQGLRNDSLGMQQHGSPCPSPEISSEDAKPRAKPQFSRAAMPPPEPVHGRAVGDKPSDFEPVSPKDHYTMLRHQMNGEQHASSWYPSLPELELSTTAKLITPGNFQTSFIFFDIDSPQLAISGSAMMEETATGGTTQQSSSEEAPPSGEAHHHGMGSHWGSILQEPIQEWEDIRQTANRSQRRGRGRKASSSSAPPKKKPSH